MLYREKIDVGIIYQSAIIHSQQNIEKGFP